MTELATSIGDAEFGFTPDTLKDKAHDYIAYVQKNVDIAKADIEAEDFEIEWLRTKTREVVESGEAVIAELNRRLENPQSFFDSIHAVYNRAKQLETDGINRSQVASIVLEEYGEQILPIRGFIESAMNQKWSYSLMQTVLAAKAREKKEA